MDSSPDQPQPSSSGRNLQKANEKLTAKREKEQQRKANIAAAMQAKRHPLRRQEGTGHLDEAFRPLYPEEPEEVQPTYQQLQAENAALRAENEQLKMEIACLKADKERTRKREVMRRKRSRTESPPVETTSRTTIWRHTQRIKRQFAPATLAILAKKLTPPTSEMQKLNTTEAQEAFATTTREVQRKIRRTLTGRGCKIFPGESQMKADLDRQTAGFRIHMRPFIGQMGPAYARQARRYKMVDNRRQIFMLKYWFSQCLLEASRPRPDDAEEYEFWDDPAFFYDDATDE